VAFITTPEGAYYYLQQYRALNDDLTRDVARTLGTFALAKRTTPEILKAVCGDVGTTPRYHRAWFWWNAMSLSGMAKYFDKFAEMRNSQVSFRKCMAWLKKRATLKQWETFHRRLGCNEAPQLSYWTTRPAGKMVLWTRGGNWRRDGNLTRVLVLKEYIEGRVFERQYQLRLGPEGVRNVEVELHKIIDPNQDVAPSCKHRAVEYVRRRFSEMLHKKRPMQYWEASWFFQTPVLDNDGRKYDWRVYRWLHPPRDKRQIDIWTW